MKPPARANERELIIKYLETFICQMYKDTIACEHQTCYKVDDIIIDLMNGNHLVK
jgi:hypothetical protein